MIVAAGAISAVAMGSGLTAWASWSVGSTGGRASIKADNLPAVGKPAVGRSAALKGGAPKVEWEAVRFPSGHAVGGYVVTRHAGLVQAEVCRVTAVMLTCTDSAAKPGTSVTYTVRAIAGKRWSGPPSPISDPVTVPGKPTASDLAAGTPSSVNAGSGPSDEASGRNTGGSTAGEKTPAGNDAAGGGGSKADATSEPAPVPATSSSAVESASVAPSPTVTAGQGAGSGDPE